MSGDSHWIDVLMARVVVQDESDQQNVFLKERGGSRGFAILIGSNEAAEIQRVLAQVEVQRPLTHQLVSDAIAALGAKLKEIRIVSLRQSTFFAQLVLERAGEDPVEVDARPSDAIALALRAGCPIRVAEDVMRDAATE